MIEIHKNPSNQELRRFAVIWLPLFCAIVGSGLYFKAHHHLAGVAVGGIAVAALTAGIAAPAVMKPVYLALMYVTFPIGWVMTHVLLALLYYGVITPVGLAMRLAGRDTMGRRFDPAAASYWVPRQPITDRERYFRQY